MADEHVDVEERLRVLGERVETARSRFNDAQQRTSIARRDETEALNELNAAQKAFDAFVQQWQKGMPGDSEWQRREREARNCRVESKIQNLVHGG